MSEKFEREKASFEQNSESVRHLNEILWKIPLIAMTLTGGLWYGIATTESLPLIVVKALLVLTAATDIALIIVLLRVRWVMDQYISKARSFNPDCYPETKWTTTSSRTSIWLSAKFGKWLVVYTFSILLLAAGVMSLCGALAFPDSLSCTNNSSASDTQKQVGLDRLSKHSLTRRQILTG